MDSIRIVPCAEEYAAGFNRAVDIVARERRYIGLVAAPPIVASLAFVRHLISGGGVQLFAVDSQNEVVGWCDVVRDSREGFRHSGRLGMGMLPAFRGKGLGERLARETIAAAWRTGLERIELEVFASNVGARRLYEKLGFVAEGVKRRSRRLDGRYDDDIFMALWVDSAGPGEFGAS